jgi:hypothetical protein
LTLSGWVFTTLSGAAAVGVETAGAVGVSPAMDRAGQRRARQASVKEIRANVALLI